MIGSARFRTTVHSVSMVTGLMKRTSTANEDVDSQVYEISTKLCKSPKINAWKLLIHFSHSRASHAAHNEGLPHLKDSLTAESSNQESAENSVRCNNLTSEKKLELSSLCKKELGLIVNALKNIGENKKPNKASENELDFAYDAIGKSVSLQSAQSLGTLRSSGIIGTPAAMLFFPPKSPGLVPGSPTVSLSSLQASSALVHFLYSWFLHHLRGVRNNDVSQINLGWHLLESNSLETGTKPEDRSTVSTQDTSQCTIPSPSRELSNNLGDSVPQSVPFSVPEVTVSEAITESGASFSLNSPKSRLPALHFDVDAMAKHKGIPLLQPLPSSSKQGSKAAELSALSQESKDLQKSFSTGNTGTQICDTVDGTEAPAAETPRKKTNVSRFWVIPVVHFCRCPFSFTPISLHDLEPQGEISLSSVECTGDRLANMELSYENDRAVLHKISKQKLTNREEMTAHMSQVAKLARNMLNNLYEFSRSNLMDNSPQQESLLDCRIKLGLFAAHIIQVWIPQ